MSKKVKWEEVDKRIRNRRENVSAAETRGIEEKLRKLPDLAEHLDVVDLVQPALTVTPEEDEESAAADVDAGAANQPN